eukprot:TRINITY_DN964_c0_g1_i2.p1 TRINITY_DN964_c0_g1~~TRINITY_DN964_c0_g1_i2.p1  ORF type:complete len:165 (-),score=18.19 TRINITY_DN964_c0_g1_i2:405-899(-)
MADSADKAATSFTVFCSGQIECCEMVGKDNLYCRYVIVAGRDWECIEGQTEGISQISQKGNGQNRNAVWNFPIDVVYNSTNAFGWPQLILSVSYINSSGKDTICGYGRMHLPVSPGRYNKRMHLFTPMASSWVQGLASWFSGTPPEFVNFKFLSEGEGREGAPS